MTVAENSDRILKPCIKVLLAALGVSAVFALIFWQRIAINPTSDLHIHITYAEEMRSLADIKSPHFLFQILIKALATLPTLSYEAATALLLGGCYGAMAVILANELQKQRSISASTVVPIAAAALIASHVFLPAALGGSVYYGYLVPTAYHNPTQQLNKLFALAIWCLWLDVIEGERRATTLEVMIIAGLCVLSAVSKPSFLLAFLPLSGLLSFKHLAAGHYDRFLRYTAAIAVPSSIVLALQYWATYGRGTGSIEFAPFVVFADPVSFALHLPWSLLFPLATVIALWPSAIRSRRLMLAWGYLAIGIAFSLLLAESGPRRFQGNFAWTAQTGVFLVYVETVIFMVSRAECPRWLWGIFILHVAFGVVYAVLNATVPATQWL